jgi:hypothetical protein
VLVHNTCGVGDLLPSEVAQIQGLVDELGAPIDVVGSAARGARRNIGSSLPIGKGAGTRSDIDFLAGPWAARAWTDPAVQSRLPSNAGGVIFGTHNPYMGPAIRFEPGFGQRFVPAKPLGG